MCMFGLGPWMSRRYVFVVVVGVCIDHDCDYVSFSRRMQGVYVWAGAVDVREVRFCGCCGCMH
jgi:hypothetical protein